MKKTITNLKLQNSLAITNCRSSKTTLCKTQSSMACTSFCSCQGGKECFSVHTKQVQIELGDDND